MMVSQVRSRSEIEGERTKSPKLPAPKRCSGQDKAGSLRWGGHTLEVLRYFSISLTALLVVSVCLEEDCPLPIGKTDFRNQHILNQIDRGQVDFDQKWGTLA